MREKHAFQRGPAFNDTGKYPTQFPSGIDDDGFLRNGIDDHVGIVDQKQTRTPDRDNPDCRGHYV
jgi:hypothetical protein